MSFSGYNPCELSSFRSPLNMRHENSKNRGII